MQIKVDKEDLRSAVTLSSANFTKTGRTSEVEIQHVDDIYESIMIESSDHGIFVHASNGNIWTKTKLPGERHSNFRVMVKNAQLSQLVMTLGDGVVDLSLNKEMTQVLLTSGRYKANFGVRSAMEYPAMPASDAKTVLIDGDGFKDLVSFVEGSADNKPDRPALCGVNLEVDGDSIWAVALDGARIAISRLSKGPQTAEDGWVGKMTLPIVLCRQAARMAARGPIEFGACQTGAVFRGEGMLVVGRVVSQQFPDWRNARNLPKEDLLASSGVGAKAEVLAAVRRCLAIMPTGSKDIAWIELSIRGSDLLIHTAHSSRKANEDVGLKSAKRAEGLVRRVHGDFLAQAISAITSTNVEIIIPDNPEYPVGVRNLPKDQNKVKYVSWIMPRL